MTTTNSGQEGISDYRAKYVIGIIDTGEDDPHNDRRYLAILRKQEEDRAHKREMREFEAVQSGEPIRAPLSERVAVFFRDQIFGL